MPTRINYHDLLQDIILDGKNRTLRFASVDEFREEKARIARLRQTLVNQDQRTRPGEISDFSHLRITGDPGKREVYIKLPARVEVIIEGEEEGDPNHG